MDTVKVSLAAENVAIQPPEPSSSGELQPVTALFVQAIGGVPADLSSRSAMLLDSGVTLSSILSTLSNTGTHLFAVPLFFCPCSAVLPEPAGIALLLLSAGPGTGVVALPLPAHTASRIHVLLVKLITVLSVLATQKRRSK